MIPYEGLKIVSGVSDALWSVHTNGATIQVNVAEMATELLRSRQLIKRLVEDCEYLYSAFVNGNVAIDTSKHTTLMKEIKESK